MIKSLIILLVIITTIALAIPIAKVIIEIWENINK